MLDYIIIPQTKAHQWHISLKYEFIEGEIHLLKLANWVAGSYMIRDFSRHIMHIQAAYNGVPVDLIQQDKNTWKLPNQSGHYQIDYVVYANDLSVRASLLDTERGFIDGACLFLYLPHRRDETCRVTFEKLPPNWSIQTTMTMVSPHVFQAANYAQLTDHPFEIGAQMEVLHFMANNIPHRIVLSGYYPAFNRDRLVQDCQKICEYELDLFGETPPFSEYAFLLHIGDQIYGGLEHISSTALHADRQSLPPHNMNEANASYTQLLGLISHEYFHAWNVKSIKPTVFMPYNLDTETYTEQLWAYEGITSYYDDLILVRAGVISLENYLNLLAQNITRVHRNAGRKLQTLAQSSFAAWHKYYKQDENSPNAITSYYQQGALAAMCLDLLIREKTHLSLDTVMQKLYARFVQTGQGTNEGQWQQLAQEFVQIDLQEFFQAALYSTHDLPLKSCLKNVGIQLHWLPDTSEGKFGYELPPIMPQPDIGCRFKQQPDGAVISHVFSGSSAENAALKPNDKIIAVDGLMCTDLIAQTQTAIGDTYILHFFRQGVLHQTQIMMQAAKANVAYLEIVDEVALKVWLLSA